jgi:phospholipid/cholesterol/gamma-HCH transport system substrate-binding protein
METRANYVLVGSCILGAIAAIVIFIFWMTRNELNNEADVYYTYFTGSVAGLSDGGTVRYRGVPVGTVGNVEIDPDDVERIRVTLKLRPGTPIRIDSTASLEMAGITGGSYVEISGGTQASPPLTAENGEIPVIKSEDSSLQSLVADAPKLLGKLNELADRANGVLSDENQHSITDMLKNFDAVSQNVEGITPDAKEAVANLNKLVADLNREVPKLVTSLQQDGASIKGAADEFHQVATNVNAVIAENRAPLRDFTGSGLSGLSELIMQLRGLTTTLTRVADRLDRDPQRYLFGDAENTGIDPKHPLSSGIPVGASR